MNVCFRLWNAILKQNKQTDKRLFIKKENKWMKIEEDYFSTTYLFKEHTFKLLRTIAVLFYYYYSLTKNYTTNSNNYTTNSNVSKSFSTSCYKQKAEIFFITRPTTWLLFLVSAKKLKRIKAYLSLNL